MKNIKWIKDDKKYLLKNDETTMVDVTVNLASVSTFNIGSKEYRVNRKGFLSPVYIVQSNEEEILKLSHSFWGSNGRIVFNDGTDCSSDYKNKGGLKMRFMDRENEILSYGRTIENGQTVPSFSIGTSMIDAEKLLILAAFGMIIFQYLFKEDSAGDDGSILLMSAAAS